MSIWGVVIISSCLNQEEIVAEPPTNIISTDCYFNLLEEGINVAFNDTYNQITINTTFSEMSNMFKSNCKNFFTNKGLFSTDYDISCTRGLYSSPFDHITNLNENQKTIVNKVSTILQLPTHHDACVAISQLYEETLNRNISIGGEDDILRYLKYIENILCFLEKESGKFDVLNILVKYNEFHEIKIKTRADLVPLQDGLYPHPLDKNKYIMVQKGNVYEFSCPTGLVFCNSNNSCNFPDSCNNEDNSWWESWGKCAAAILGGAGIEGLAGAGIGTVVPGLGNLTGAIIGAISGAFTGAVLGC